MTEYYIKIILQAAQQLKVSGALLLAICTQESSLRNVVVPNDNGSPSFGICQLKYETVLFLGHKGSKEELMDPSTNAFWAAKYVAYHQKRYGNDWIKIAAAYNAGKFKESEVYPGCPKNRTYIKKVKQYLQSHLKHRMECEDNSYTRRGKYVR